jgi:hypothetical protein
MSWLDPDHRRREFVPRAQKARRFTLDKSALALERLEACFEQNGRKGIEANPFVAPSRKPQRERNCFRLKRDVAPP